MPRALHAAQCLAQSELHARCWLPSYRFPEPPFPSILPRGDTAQCTVEFVAAGLGQKQPLLLLFGSAPWWCLVLAYPLMSQGQAIRGTPTTWPPKDPGAHELGA